MLSLFIIHHPSSHPFSIHLAIHPSSHPSYSIHPCNYSYIHPSTSSSHLAIHSLSIHLIYHVFIHLSIHPLVHSSIYPFIYLFIHLVYHVFIHPSTYPSTSLSIHSSILQHGAQLRQDYEDTKADLPWLQLEEENLDQISVSSSSDSYVPRSRDAYVAESSLRLTVRYLPY